MKQNRIIFHIDMNSYFASVSQHYNPEFRNKPIAVMGKGKGTVVIAASKEAKKFGIKTGTHRRDAEKMCPGIIFVEPNFAAYVHTTSILMEVFHTFTPLVEPFSIDEAFLDVTDTYQIKNGMHPVDLAYLIKQELKKQLGEVITCSVGIADNKLMAKFGSDLKKPDGLVYLTPDKYTQTLDQYPLMDLCGIGFRTFRHLENLGISNIPDLRKTDYKILKREFGRVTGRFLYNASRGISFNKVDPSKFFVDPKSVSHSETFTENKTGIELYSNIYKLCEKVSLRLRKKGLYTRFINILLKDKNFKSYDFSQKLSYHTNNTLEIYQKIIKNIPEDFTARFVCIYAVDLSRDRVKDIFSETEKIDYLQKAVDKINTRYGHFAILPASINRPENIMENNVDIPFSGFDIDAKIGMDLTTLLRKDLDIIKHKILHS